MASVSQLFSLMATEAIETQNAKHSDFLFESNFTVPLQSSGVDTIWDSRWHVVIPDPRRGPSERKAVRLKGNWSSNSSEWGSCIFGGDNPHQHPLGRYIANKPADSKSVSSF